MGETSVHVNGSETDTNTNNETSNETTNVMQGYIPAPFAKIKIKN